MDSTHSAMTALEALKAELRRRQEVVDEIKAEWANAKIGYQQRIDTAEKELQEFKDEIDRSLGLSREMTVEKRRERVLEMWFAECTKNHMAKELGVSTSTIGQDIWKLEKEGRLPIPLRSPDDEENRLHNHVIRAWKSWGINDSEDVAKALKISPEKAEEEVTWLGEQGYIKVAEDAEKVDAPDAPPPPVVVDPPAAVTPPPAPIPAPTVTAGPSAPTWPQVAAASKPKPEPEPDPEDDEDDEDDGAGSEKLAATEELQVEVRRQQGGQKQKPAKLKTSNNRNHRHAATVDFFGDGQTAVDSSGHVHRVSQFFIRNAHGHAHQFTRPE